MYLSNYLRIPDINGYYVSHNAMGVTFFLQEHSFFTIKEISRLYADV